MVSAPAPSNPLPPQQANPSTTIANHTNKYNYINTLTKPKICSTPSKFTDVTGTCLVDNPITNADRYAVAYPITGQVLDAVDSRKNGHVASNGFYQGPDKSLGSNYFEVLGKCGPDSVPECVGKDRSVYIRNITTGKVPLFGNVSLAEVTGTSTGVFGSNGILPSMLDVGVSTFTPENLVSNMFEHTGNFGGSTCRRVKLPVGTHIYDPQMKAHLDYSDINSCTNGQQPDLETRQYRTKKQVNSWIQGTDPTTGEATHPRSWWYEERCSPSYHWAVKPNSYLDADTEHNESAYLPSAKPLVEIEPTYDIDSIPTLSNEDACNPRAEDEGFLGSSHTNQPIVMKMGVSVSETWQWWVVALFGLALLCMFGLGGVLHRLCRNRN